MDRATTVFVPSAERSVAELHLPRNRRVPRNAASRTNLERWALAIAVPASLGMSLLIGTALLRALGPAEHYPDLAATLVLFLALGAACFVLEAPKRTTRRLNDSFVWGTKRAAMGVAVGTLIAVVAAPLIDTRPQPPELAGQMLVIAFPAFFLLPSARQFRTRASRQVGERVLILGSGQVADAVARRLSLHRWIELVGTVDSEPTESTLGGLAELGEICQRHQIGRVVVAFSRSPSHETVEFLRRLDPNVSVSVVPRMFELLNWSSDIEEFDGLPLLHVSRPQLARSARTVKRSLDIGAAGTALIVLLPVFLALSIAIKLDSRGPVFFRQARTGRGGRTFRIFKFRTMRRGSESERERLEAYSEVDGPIFKIHDDPRVTAVGRWLRRTSIDELPQLINVIKGDMSLVGPRPFPVHEADQIIGWSVDRTNVRPGITGLWQVSGRNDLSFDDLRYLDSLYVASWSIWWDLRILLQTPGRVLRRDGAY